MNWGDYQKPISRHKTSGSIPSQVLVSHSTPTSLKARATYPLTARLAPSGAEDRPQPRWSGATVSGSTRLGSTETRAVLVHPADMKADVSSFAKTVCSANGSACMRPTVTQNFLPACLRRSAISLCICSGFKCLGFLSFWRANSASAVRAWALAISACAFAISACAAPRSALALAVSASNTEVRQSDCSSRILVVRHCNSKKAMVAHAPIAVITPPARTPFQEIGYQYSAQSSSEGSTATRSAPLWFFSAMAIVNVAPVALLAFFAFALWRWGPRR